MSTPAREIQESYERAKSIVQHIVRERNAATPHNYAVWYAYTRGSPLELVAQIDACRSAGRAVSDAECAYAFDQFLSPIREVDLDNVFHTLVENLQRTVDSLDYGQQGIRRCTVDLRDAQSSLRISADREELHSALQRLTAVVHEARARHSALVELLSASRKEVDDAQSTLAALRAESRTDPLTGLSNRRDFEDALMAAIESAPASLSLAVFDVDNFKRFNDTHGHVTGDHVLKLVAAILRDCAGGRVAGRHGGEEFGIVCAGENIQDAAAVAEKARGLMMAQKLKKKSTGEPLGIITISAGVAQFEPGDTMQTLLARADERLYVAKRSGRNRVVSIS